MMGMMFLTQLIFHLFLCVYRYGPFDKDLNMEIKNRDDFLIFLQNFINEMDAGEFENNTLSGFLEAMRYWIKDMDGYYKNVGKEENFDKQR